jgi:hypothetical protein
VRHSWCHPIVRHAAVGEVADDAVGRVPERPGRHGGHLGERPGPERGGRGEAVDEAAALDEGRSVGTDEVHGVLQEAVERGDVPRRASAGQLGGAGHPRPEHGIEVHRPAGVVVVGALVAVRQPAVGADVGVVPGEVGGDVVGRPRPADRAQEGLHDDAEPEPVVARVGLVADDGREIAGHPLAGDLVEAVPDPRTGQVEDERDRGGLDLRLRVFLHAHPPVRRLRVDARADARQEEVDQVVDAGAAFARDAESAEQERAREALQPVDGSAVPALVSGRGDARAAGRRPRHRASEKPVGVGRPLASRPIRARRDAVGRGLR